MGKTNLSKLHYMLLALLLLALTGCGASTKTAGSADKAAAGKVTAKLVWGANGTAKRVALAPADVSTIQFTVTGTATAGGAIPVVRGSFAGTATSGQVDGVYPGKVTVAVKGLAADGTTVLFEGYAIGLTVKPGVVSDAGTITMKPPVTKAQDVACVNCHETTLDIDGQNLVADFKQSGHYTNSSWNTNAKFGVTGTGCAGCHGPQHNDANPAGSGRCFECHGATLDANHTGSYLNATNSNCGTCHQPHNTKPATCVGCHALPQNAGAGFVQDNNGVRAIASEFTKWSHHVTGVTLQDAHCAACHLEGQVVSGKIQVNPTYHMADNMTHLRNADTDADMQWNPAAPNHTTMDNFCMSCHDADGATSAQSAAIRVAMVPAAGKTASAKNPFADTISNRYDKMQRPGVIDVSNQFNTTNNSHHGVKGPRYSKRTRVENAADPRAMTAAESAAFANNSSALLQGVRSTIFDAGNLNQLYTPLENAGGEVAPRTGAKTLGDDSTLHCGDCHTVGQWKVGSSTIANGSPTPVAIGAHGSNNEYLLRNSIGTDARHTQNAFTKDANNVVSYTNPNGAFLVCYNCHAYSKYGSIYVGTGLGSNTPGSIGQPHAGEYDDAGRCNGIGNTLPFNGYTTGTATDGTQFVSRLGASVIPGTTTGNSLAVFAQTPAFAPGFPLDGTPPVGEQNADFGNIFGIQCLNCHNSGAGNAYGGIHGSWNNTDTTPSKLVAGTPANGGYYVDGMGNTVKNQRFLPGLGDAMHSPGTLGGFTGGSVVPIDTTTGPAYTYITGGVSNDTNWEQKAWNQTTGTIFNAANHSVSPTVSAGAGCYTLGGATAATSALRGPSVTGEGGAATELLDTWGGCDDHGAAQGKGNHGFVKAIVRPITY